MSRQNEQDACELDTLSMIWIWRHWTSRTSGGHFRPVNRT
jgi:hypothetical protein